VLLGGRLSKSFQKTPGRMQKLIEQLAKQGQVKIEEDMLGTVYPTVAAIRAQDPSLSESQARAMLRKAKG